jgi:hypothetical protein
MASASSRKAVQLVKRRLFASREYWRNDNQRYARLLNESLLLQHYRRDAELAKESWRIRPKTLKQFNLLRHNASHLLRQMPEFETHAVQPGADESAAEISKRIIQQNFFDPLKCYHDVRSRMVWSGLSAERGNIEIAWDAKWGVCFNAVDPRRFHLTPGFTFLHDPRNPAVQHEVPMKLSEVQRMGKLAGWNVPKDLYGDGAYLEYGQGNYREADGIERDQAMRYVPDPNDGPDTLVTVCKTWFREDPFAPDNAWLGKSDMAESDWHFVDDTSQETVRFDPMNPTPPTGRSGQPMRLVTSNAEKYTGHEYDDGYLIITAPYYTGDQPLFEGSWTEGALSKDATLCAFPYMEFSSYKHPLRRNGISDTAKRNMHEQMSNTGLLLVTVPGALRDAEGKQYKFKNLPIDIAYADSVLNAEATKFLQGPGMNAAAGQFANIIDRMWQDIGTGDFSASLGPERSKDIAVGTANMLQQTGDLPVQLHQQDLNLQEAIGGRVVLDWCRAYMGDQVVSWVSDQGEAVYAHVRGQDLVPLHVTVVVGKEWVASDTDRVQAQAQLIGMLGKSNLPPQAQLALMKDAGVGTETLSAMHDALNQPPPKPDPAAVTAQAAMITAIAKAGLPPTALAPMLADAGVDPAIIQALMQVLGAGQPMAGTAPPSPGGNPNLQLIQGGGQ